MGKLSYFLNAFSSLIMINCIYREEAFHFFDSFYYKDKFEIYEKQQSKKKCSGHDGPNCFFLSKYNEIEDSLINSEPEIKTIKYKTLNKIKNYLLDSTDIIKNKDKNKFSQIFEINNDLEMSFLLNFDLYDIKTQKNDIIAPEEILSEFEYDYIKLTIYGKLILTYKNQIKPKKIPETLEEEINTPSGTYGIIDSNHLKIKFDKPMFLISLFIKKNINNKSDKPFNIFAEYKGESFVIATELNAEYNKWIKVNTIYALSNSIILPKGFDIDNINIYYSSNYDDFYIPKFKNEKYSKKIDKSIIEGIISNKIQIVNYAEYENFNEYLNIKQNEEIEELN